MITAGMALGVNQISALSYNRIIGANDKIRVGFIGVGNRGTQLLQTFMIMPDCEVAALCDVYEPYITRDRSKVDPRYIKDRPAQIPKMGEVFPGKVERYLEYRKLLENKSIDAVCIATPDHSFSPGRQGCLYREASFKNSRGRPCNDQCCKKQQTNSHRRIEQESSLRMLSGMELQGLCSGTIIRDNFNTPLS